MKIHPGTEQMIVLITVVGLVRELKRSSSKYYIPLYFPTVRPGRVD